MFSDAGSTPAASTTKFIIKSIIYKNPSVKQVPASNRIKNSPLISSICKNKEIISRKADVAHQWSHEQIIRVFYFRLRDSMRQLQELTTLVDYFGNAEIYSSKMRSDKYSFAIYSQ